MTEFRSYPERTMELDPHGKVTGTLRLIARGDGSLMAMTDAYHNTDRGSGPVRFRNREWLVTVDMTHDPKTGQVSPAMTEQYGRPVPSRVFVSERGVVGVDSAPPTFRDAIVTAICDATAKAWTPEFEREGLEADVAQQLHRLECNEAEQAATLKATRAALRHAKRRLPR